ncbi:MAG TPA: metalloregulator ArsR/SmtB family transcription factor [Lachnospiraceae bacterium]|nr:metalloregulator ArsR/SmtB family transcription factor [Lachnospiraceae bacterium]
MNLKEDARMIKALADENRLAILELLQDGEKCGCVLLEQLSITQPTLSHHMKILCDCGIVNSCKDGKWMHYSLSFDGSKKLRKMIDHYTVDEVKNPEYKKCGNCV